MKKLSTSSRKFSASWRPKFEEERAAKRIEAEAQAAAEVIAAELADVPKRRVPYITAVVRKLADAAEEGSERKLALEACLAKIQTW